MAKDINFFGSWTNVPYVDLPQIGGGSARFTDVTNTTASAADVSQNKYFYTASGVYTQGSSTGGGADSTFVITLSWNNTSEMWEPDCTYAQLSSAVSAGKRITIEVPPEDLAGANCEWNMEEACLYYIVFQSDSVDWTQNVYVFSSDGLDVNYTDTISRPSGTINITASGNTDVTQYATASVPNANYEPDGVTGEFLTINGIRKWRAQSGLTVESAGWITSGYKESYATTYNAVAANTTITPSTSAQTIGDANYMMEGAVTVAAMPNGTAGTPTATKGTISNHAISVIPSVTNTTGYITGGTKTGTAVTVSANELVSGTLEVTTNGTKDVTNYATVSVAVPVGQEINNQDKTITPSESQQTVTADSGYTGLGTVTVKGITASYVGSGVTQRSSSDLTVSGATITAPAGYYASAASKSVTTMTLPTTTAAAATSGYTSKATISRSTSDQYINIPPGYNSAGGYYKINAVANGSSTPPATISGSSANLTTGTNTLTLSKTISVTPVVNAGYISAGTAGNVTVTLTASVTTKGAATITPGTTNQTISSGTYLTGTQTIVGDANLLADNIKKDVTIFGTTGTYEGEGGSGESDITVATATRTLSSAASSISFTGLSGNPTSFVIVSSSDQTTGGTKVVSVVYDGTSFHGMNVTTQAAADTGFSKTYSNGTLTVTASTASFQANEYKLIYTYGGTSSDVYTSDVQVGSGATSITFSGLNGRPKYFSCIFKSDFSTSSGYQRVIEVVNDGTNTYGHAFDSTANAQTSWSYSYSGNSLTITSQGTNNGGYFHQPGYYQLTYVIDENGLNLQTKTNITPSNSSQTIVPDEGYDGLASVQINAIPSSYVQPTATRGATTYTPGTTNQTIASGTYLTGTQTIAGDANLVAGNIISGKTIFGVAGNVVLQTYYTGSSTPSSSLGSNGDIYLQA